MANPPYTDKDYERLGRQVDHLIKSYKVQTLPQQVWRSFVTGVFGGLGGIIGATLMVALVLALLQHITGVPFVGHYVDNLRQTIQSHSTK